MRIASEPVFTVSPIAAVELVYVFLVEQRNKIHKASDTQVVKSLFDSPA